MSISEENDLERYKDFTDRVKNPKTSITEEKLKDMKKQVLESLSVDRHKLLTSMPFTGGMVMHFELIPTRDYRISTAMTDGSRIFFDIDFYSRLAQNERVFVLAHECWHCIYLHFLRKMDRIPSLWNIATDCEINQMLKTQGFKAPKDLCYPEECDVGKNAEEIYERMFKKLKNESKKKGDSEDYTSDNQSDYGDGCKNEKSKGSENPGQSSKQSSKKPQKEGNNGSADGSLTGQFDKHATDNDEDSYSLPKDKWGEKGEDPDYNPRIESGVEERIREYVISEVQRYERDKGSIPGSLESVLKTYLKPEISWRELLCQEVTKCYSERRQWLPPNRRHVHKGLYLQSHRGERLKCCVMIDTSGSTTNDLPKFMGELISLLNTFSNYDLKLIQCDSEVHSVETYDESNPFPLEDCSKIKFKGFGGSDLNPAFEYLENSNIEDGEDYPNMIIVFTDGYIDVPQDPPPSNVIWILTKDGNENLCSYGRKILFKNENNH